MARFREREGGVWHPVEAGAGDILCLAQQPNRRDPCVAQDAYVSSSFRSGGGIGDAWCPADTMNRDKALSREVVPRKSTTSTVIAFFLRKTASMSSVIAISVIPPPRGNNGI